MISRSLADFLQEFSYDQVLSYQLKEGVALNGAKLVTGTGLPAELAELVTSLEHSSASCLLLHETLETSTIANGVFMCPPIYRDVLVFKDQEDRTTGILHICFSCYHLEDHLGNLVSCSVTGFERLATLMKGLGHRVRTDSY
jgi:hypothetical protein